MSTVRCKFVCQSVSRSKHGDNKDIYSARFTPVTGGSDENKAFWAATPGGSLEVYSVLAPFEPGQAYYLDISPAGT